MKAKPVQNRLSHCVHVCFFPNHSFQHRRSAVVAHMCSSQWKHLFCLHAAGDFQIVSEGAGTASWSKGKSGIHLRLRYAIIVSTKTLSSFRQSIGRRAVTITFHLWHHLTRIPEFFPPLPSNASRPTTVARTLTSTLWVTLPMEIIAIMEQERPDFEEMEALAMASIFWRRSWQTCADMDNRQAFEAVDTI